MNARRLLVLLVLLTALVPASSATASFPGPVGRIVFTSPGESTSDIYSVAADGTDLQRLTLTAGFEQDPAWSADASHIAYESSYQGRFRIFVMNQDGTDQHLVSPAGGSTADDVQPSWSPDGTQIAFASTRGGGWNIWVMNADGTGLRELAGALTEHPAWSPDGSRIAGDVAGSAIFSIGVDGTNQRRLATAPAFHNDESPDWSPDGTTLVFSESAQDGTSSALYAVGAGGTGERQLTSGAFADYDPSWSPDGARIAFRRNQQLFTVGAAGGAATPLLGMGGVFGPSWGSATTSPPLPEAPQVQIFSPTGTGIYFPGHADVVFYLCTSDFSPVVSCVGSQPNISLLDVSSAGLHRLSVTATDAQGRQTTVTVIYTVLDLTPPTIALRAPTDGATYELGANVTVEYDCRDEAGGSGIQYCGGTFPSGIPLDTSHLGSFPFQVFALDGANNLATASGTYRVVDSIPPAIAIKTPPAGVTYGLGDNVTVDYTCSDSGSGVQSCAGTRPSGTQLDTGHLGSFTFQVAATDVAGNTATATTTYSVVDRTPPSIVITTPANGGTYTLGQIVTADYACADEPNGSGVLSCSGDLTPGALVDTSSVGSRTFTVRATDRAQNSASASSSYRVVYDFSGFSPPVAGYPTVDAVKAGEGIPLKFSLHGNRGSDILAAGSPVWTPCDTSSGGATAGTGTLSYNASLDRYTFLAATSKSWAGTCADLTVTLRDGTTHQARFAFGK